MDQKRFLTFIVLSMAILIGWSVFVMPLMRPNKPKAAAQNEADQNKAIGPEAHDDARQVAEKGEAAAPGAGGALAAKEKKSNPEPGDEAAPAVAGKDSDQAAADGKEPEQKPAAPAALAKFPEKTVELGSDEPQTMYRQLVTLTSRGAAVKSIRLNDPRYRDLTKPHPALVVVGARGVVPHSFEMEVPQVKADLDSLNWELVKLAPAVGPHSIAEFRLTVDDLQVVKRYELRQIDPQNPTRPEAPAYTMKVDLTFRNLGHEPRTISYTLQGPTGLPLENAENTQKFRDVVVGFAAPEGGIDHELMSGKVIADGKIEEWKRPLKYIGLDAQFFAALISPVGDQIKSPYIESIKQDVVELNKTEKQKSEVSVELTSVELPLAAAKTAGGGDSVTHSYEFFAGPKRDNVLPLGAERVVDFGWFHFISRPMLWLLKGFHSLFGSWGIAVICLTILVRSAMFPVSIRQARSAAKMQTIQPEIAALKEKYGKDKEKFARAQMELYRKHSFNPFGGCLPVFIQLPIFMGLYQALNHAVDLRLASFLWIDNLAAPDALFHMPFALPFLGNDFNLLPIITTTLFYVQQKMFMPPPASEEQVMQQKMMNFMMIFMGVMFYKVPAGLCVYFIASSLWGMGERKLLPKAKPISKVEPPPAGPSSGRRKPPDSDNGDDGGGGSGGGFWAMLLKAAEKETSARRASGERRK